MRKTPIKLYSVTFNTYTNYSHDTVAKYTDKLSFDADYISIPIGGLIIREDEFDFYKEYGDGFASLNFIGCLLEDEK